MLSNTLEVRHNGVMTGLCGRGDGSYDFKVFLPSARVGTLKPLSTARLGLNEAVLTAKLGNNEKYFESPD